MTAGTMASPPRYAPSSEPFSVELMRDRFRVVGELASKADAQKLIDILMMAVKLLPDSAPNERVAENDDAFGEGD
jgi:hypothetical protein